MCKPSFSAGPAVHICYPLRRSVTRNHASRVVSRYGSQELQGERARIKVQHP